MLNLLVGPEFLLRVCKDPGRTRSDELQYEYHQQDNHQDADNVVHRLFTSPRLAFGPPSKPLQGSGAPIEKG